MEMKFVVCSPFNRQSQVLLPEDPPPHQEPVCNRKYPGLSPGPRAFGSFLLLCCFCRVRCHGRHGPCINSRPLLSPPALWVSFPLTLPFARSLTLSIHRRQTVLDPRRSVKTARWTRTLCSVGRPPGSSCLASSQRPTPHPTPPSVHPSHPLPPSP